MDLEALSDEELEALLFEDDDSSQTNSALNLPTVAGLSLIGIGMLYLFQHLGMFAGFDITQWVVILPWIAGILIILLGLGVLSWRPRKKARVKRKAVRTKVSTEGTQVEEVEVRVNQKKRLTRSRDKKIAGVCAGIAEYFNIDPTLVRVVFLVGTIVTNGAFLLAYIVLSVVMPKEKLPSASEERITIIRD